MPTKVDAAMVKAANVKLKVCLLGDGAVGKTSLINRFVNNMFSEEYLLTIGTRTSKKIIAANDLGWKYEVSITMLIWDIMGQISFRKLLHPEYLKGARGAIIVCDLTRRETLEHFDDWIDSLFVEGKVIPAVFVANKSDMEVEVGFESSDLERIASVYDAPFFITSAKTGENVENAFLTLGDRILSNSNYNRKPLLDRRVEDPWIYNPISYDFQLHL